MSFPCPRCTGRYTQRLPIVFHEGTRHWTSERIWTGYRWYRSRSRSSGTSQTGLAAFAAPPRQVGTRLQWVAMILFLLTGAQLVTALYGRWVRSNFPVAGTHHLAPIIDGPDALRQKLQRARRAPIHPSAPATKTQQAQVDPGWSADTMVLFTVVDILGIAMLMVSISRAWKYNREVWAPGMATWNDSYLCKGCGQVFLPR
jgi:hypothetical protein